MARGGRDGQRGGSSGGGSSRANMPRDVQVSKALSKLLRHGAEKEGLKLGAGGYINVKDVVSHMHISPNAAAPWNYMKFCDTIANTTLIKHHS